MLFMRESQITAVPPPSEELPDVARKLPTPETSQDTPSHSKPSTYPHRDSPIPSSQDIGSQSRAGSTSRLTPRKHQSVHEPTISMHKISPTSWCLPHETTLPYLRIFSLLEMAESVPCSGGWTGCVVTCSRGTVLGEGCAVVGWGARWLVV